jgi:hypothetical protein
MNKKPGKQSPEFSRKKEKLPEVCKVWVSDDLTKEIRSIVVTFKFLLNGKKCAKSFTCISSQEDYEKYNICRQIKWLAYAQIPKSDTVWFIIEEGRAWGSGTGYCLKRLINIYWALAISEYFVRCFIKGLDCCRMWE